MMELGWKTDAGGFRLCVRVDFGGQNCHTKHCTATFAKPLLAAGVLVVRVCKPLSLFGFLSFVCRVLRGVFYFF
jgi:hypothetical protein